MARLEDLTKGAAVKGVLPDQTVTVVDVQWHGSAVVELTYRDGHLLPARGTNVLMHGRHAVVDLRGS